MLNVTITNITNIFFKINTFFLNQKEFVTLFENLFAVNVNFLEIPQNKAFNT